MFCKNCGKELADSAFMCPECGEPTGKGTVHNNKKEKTAHLEPLSLIGFMISLVALIFGITLLACGFSILSETEGMLIVTSYLDTAAFLPALVALSLGIYSYTKNAGQDAPKNKLSAFSVIISIIVIVLCLVAFALEYSIYIP